MKNLCILGSTLILIATAAACGKETPAGPTTTPATTSTASVEDLTVSLSIPQLVTPRADEQVRFADQPITLSVRNAASTGATPLYTFQVASDAAFANMVYARDGVAQGGGGVTNLAIDRLAGNKTYYWRARAVSGDQPGPFAKARALAIGPEVVLGTPSLSSPANGSPAFSPLTLTVTNIARSGPAGPIVYKVEVAGDATFNNVLFTTDAAEQDGPVTSITATVNGLADNGTYYWRARATDTLNDITTAYSDGAAFTAQSFNIRAATFWDNPPDTGQWPVGARITSVEFTGSAMRVDFDRRMGPNRWPDVVPPRWTGALQYTLGLCRNVAGGWHCSAVVQFWNGRSLDDTAPPSRFWREWWYDSARWGPLASIRPVEGEMVGVFVASGDLRQRFFTQASCPRVCEISNVVLVPFTSGYAKYEY